MKAESQEIKTNCFERHMAKRGPVDHHGDSAVSHGIHKQFRTHSIRDTLMSDRRKSGENVREECSIESPAGENHGSTVILKGPHLPDRRE